VKNFLKTEYLNSRLQPATWLMMSLLTIPVPALAQWQFSEVSEAAGISILHGHVNNDNPGVRMMAGGVAAADYDRDGDTDLYIITGDITPNVLMRNNGNGSFTKMPDSHGAGLAGEVNSGPAFADVDADGWPDLVVGGIAGSGYHLFRNLGDGTFAEITDEAGFFAAESTQNDYSSAFGDPDNDGDLDLFVAHWGANVPTNHLWLNRGDGQFVASDEWAGITYYREYGADSSFSPVFTDINGDHEQDLLVAADYGTSQYFMCEENARYTLSTTEEISDENGMGAAAADFDNDGDIDWFVTSILDPAVPLTWGSSGNRLYENDGQGNFTNITDQAGVAEGSWGWSACAADFNNDGWLDIFHINGFEPYGHNQTDFSEDPSVLFINNKDGTFTEMSQALNINDTGQGRGLVCFDYDHDGDLDILTTNWEGLTKLYRNDLQDNPGYLQVLLQGETNNPSAVGAVVRVTANGITQMREITVGTNYASQNPLTQHFGLDGAGKADEVSVRWPHGGETVLTNVGANQVLNLSAADSTPAPFALEPGISAAWYDPAHDGEGFMLELLSGNRAVLYWFTYDSNGEQDWYIAVGDVDGRRIVFPELLRISGGEFGPGFDPGNVSESIVGSAAFTWDSCNVAKMDWVIGNELGAEQQGRMKLQRLSTVMGLDCGPPKPTPPPIPEYGLSGSWYDPSHGGEGYTLEVLADGRVLVYWFSFDPQGERRWFFGVGNAENGKLVFDSILTTRGGVFGEDFDPATVEGLPWGSLELDIGCGGGTATYSSTEAGFGSGQLQVQRLSSLQNLSCE